MHAIKERLFVPVLLMATLPLLFAAACASSNNNSSSARTNTGNAAASVAPVGAALTASPAGGASEAAEIKGIAFPASITVKPGTTVTWTNHDSVSHTVTSDAGQAQSFDSNTLAPNGAFSVTFAKAGTYHYHCNIHASMHGTVVVSDTASGAAAPATAAPAKSSSPYDPGYKY